MHETNAPRNTPIAVWLASRGSTTSDAKFSSTPCQPGVNPTLRVNTPASGIGKRDGVRYSSQKLSVVFAFPCLGIARFAQLCAAVVIFVHPM